MAGEAHLAIPPRWAATCGCDEAGEAPDEMRWHTCDISVVWHWPVAASLVCKPVDDAAAKAKQGRPHPSRTTTIAGGAAPQRGGGRLDDGVGDETRWGRHRSADDVVVGGRGGHRRST